MAAVLTHRDVLRRSRSAYGQRTALTGPDGASLSFAELDAQSNRLAHALVGHGLGRGRRMVWIDQNSAEYLVAYYATAKAGMTISPVNYWLRPGEMAPLLELVDPDVLVASDEYLGIVDDAAVGPECVRVALGGQAPPGWLPWDDLVRDGDPDGPDVEVSEDDVHEVIFTSGTTGQAKGVMRTQRARILDSYTAALAYELGRNDHLLWFMPQFHVGGAAVPGQLLQQGGRVTILRKFDPLLAAEAIGEGVTYIVGVPAHYNLMFESGALEGRNTDSVRGCFVGGSVATRRVFESILRHFPRAELVHGYGSTESGPHTMALRGAEFLDHFGALGLPVPGTEVRVVDGTSGADVDDGAIGELWVRSESVMSGYLGRPDLTAAAFADDGWLRTGDLVRRGPDGYFSIVDRAKDTIITGGENVYPKEVEDVIATHPAVAEVAVIGVPDDVFEEQVVAIVRRAAEGPGATAQEIIEFVRARLAGFKTPRTVQFVDDFPRIAVGKVAKHELRSTYGSVFGQDP